LDDDDGPKSAMSNLSELASDGVHSSASVLMEDREDRRGSINRASATRRGATNERSSAITRDCRAIAATQLFAPRGSRRAIIALRRRGAKFGHS